MKYLCLVYYDESRVYGQMSQDEWEALVARCLDYGRSVQASGHFLGGEALQPVATACTVRVRDGRATVTDGPFAETREQLAGFYLFEAADMNEAVRLASGIPPAGLGSIEVRPVRELVPANGS